MEQPFQIKENFSNRKATRLHQDRQEEDYFLEKKHMKEQIKIKITTKVEVEVEKEEEHICKRTTLEIQDCFFKYTKYKNSSHSERNC